MKGERKSGLAADADALRREMELSDARAFAAQGNEGSNLGAPRSRAEREVEHEHNKSEVSVTPPQEDESPDRSAGAESAVAAFLDLALKQAVDWRASDVHFEPFETEFKLRYRIDGVLREMTPPALALAVPVISRLKVLANLNIAERRRPQDGRFAFSCAGRSIDFRISTLPTQFGESVVLRVLDQSHAPLELEQLGLPGPVLTGVKRALAKPNGLLLVTGPTGSGKTTTLYSALRRLNTTDVKILTAEDPVEYEIDGVVQLGVAPEIGLTFAAALRSFLRQDPDVIMVGEIRDAETAEIAVQAALTGHLVLSTLHTNDAASAVTRLIDLGVEPFLVSAALGGVLAQRLLRRVCPQCRVVDSDSAAREFWRGARLIEMQDRPTFHGAGCEHCQFTGYSGRIGIHEWLPMTETLRGQISARAAAQSMRDAAVAGGMQTLRVRAIELLCAGETSREEAGSYL